MLIARCKFNCMASKEIEKGPYPFYLTPGFTQRAFESDKFQELMAFLIIKRYVESIIRIEEG